MKTEVTVKRAPPEIILTKTKGGRKRYQYVGDGRWSHEAIAQVMLMSDQKEWLSIPKLAQIAFRAATLANQKKTRERISTLWHYLFKHHSRVLIKEYERRQSDVRVMGRIRKTPLKGRNIIMRVKLAGFEDKALAESELDERLRHNEISREEMERMQDSLLRLTGPA